MKLIMSVVHNKPKLSPHMIKPLALFYFSDKLEHEPTHHLLCIKALYRLSRLTKLVTATLIPNSCLHGSGSVEMKSDGLSPGLSAYNWGEGDSFRGEETRSSLV